MNKKSTDNIIAFIIIILFFPTIYVLSSLAGAPSTGLRVFNDILMEHQLELIIGTIGGIIYVFLRR